MEGPRAHGFLVAPGYAARMQRPSACLLTAIAVLGCASVVSSATARLAEDLSSAVRNQSDPETVRQGAPAYLLLVDGLIDGSPDDVELLLAGASLYSVYTSAFVEDAERAARLSERGRAYGRRALCLEEPALCRAVDRPYDDFAAALAQTRPRDVPVLYGFGSAWAAWIQTHSDDWNAIAELPKLEALMERIVELEDGYDAGGAHLYLGVLSTQRPATLGGQPERGRRHFERADEIAGGRNLIVKVLFAEHYARLVFDRELHDQLLREALAVDPQQPGFTLSNTLAQARARELLAGADDYF